MDIEIDDSQMDRERDINGQRDGWSDRERDDQKDGRTVQTIMVNSSLATNRLLTSSPGEALELCIYNNIKPSVMVNHKSFAA